MPDVIEPGTPEWHAARVGCWTASRAPALMARTAKGEPRQECLDLIAEVVAERRSGVPVERFVTGAMRRGLELEPEALNEYAFRAGTVVAPGALVRHPTIPHVAATPDGFVGARGLVEIKCPASMAKHLAALLDSRAATGGMADRLRKASPVREYGDQCQWQMWVTGRAWGDLVSYDPRFTGDDGLAIVRLEADAERHEAFAAAVAWAEECVADALAGLTTEAAQ